MKRESFVGNGRNRIALPASFVMKEFRGQIDRWETRTRAEATLEENQPDGVNDGDPGDDVGEDEPVSQPTVWGWSLR